MAEGAPLLREYAGKNLHRGFESLSLRQNQSPPSGGLSSFMPIDLVSILVLVATSAVTFTLARVLGRKWRARRREKEQAASRANESRQVRRARERAQRSK